jgi:hypothetical protein
MDSDSTSSSSPPQFPAASPQIALPPRPPYRSKPRKNRFIWILLWVGTPLIAIAVAVGVRAVITGGKAADAEIVRFHDLYNRQAFDEIIAQADPGFQQAEKKEALIKLLSAVHRKLGSARASSRTFINVNSNGGGTFIRATFTTEFEREIATETVTWRKVNGQLKLYGYNIESNKLVTD